MKYWIDGILNHYNKCIVWGAGEYYRLFHKFFDEKISYIIDNDKAKQGTQCDKHQIFSPFKLNEEEQSKCLIIVCNAKFTMIFEEIKAYGKFDVIDASMVPLLCECERTAIKNIKVNNNQKTVLVCGGLHAFWLVNGSRKFIDNQNEVLRRNGYNTLEIIPLPYYLKGENRCFYVAANLNQIHLGVFTIEELIRDFPSVEGMIIHSLYYNHELLHWLLKHINVAHNILYYLHDYYCVCNQRFFFFNEHSCINEKNELDCSICSNSENQKEIYQFHKELFMKFQIILIAPSEVVAQRVEAIFPDTQVQILEHLQYTVKNFICEKRSRIKIAFIGYASKVKGWAGFCKIVKNIGNQYEFYCLGNWKEDQKIPGVTYVTVNFENGISMVETLKKYSIDIAYIGSISEETYSYTYFEAFETGCFIITTTQSGNVSAQVNKHENGIAFQTVTEMIEWLRNTEQVSFEIKTKRKYLTDIKTNESFLKYLNGDDIKK